jgi:hypothetical protein
MYDGVVVLMQLSAAALMSSHEHDRETTTLSLTKTNGKMLIIKFSLFASHQKFSTIVVNEI